MSKKAIAPSIKVLKHAETELLDAEYFLTAVCEKRQPFDYDIALRCAEACKNAAHVINATHKVFLASLAEETEL